jgi:four helix bundle protein
MKNFKDLIVWRRAHELVLALYKTTQSFPKEELYTLTSQLRRAGISIPTNLAEGCGRWPDADFARFVQIAFGSAQEVEYLLLLSFDLGYYPLSDFRTLDSKVNEVKGMLLGLIKTLRQKKRKYI